MATNFRSIGQKPTSFPEASPPARVLLKPPRADVNRYDRLRRSTGADYHANTARENSPVQ